MKLNLACGTDVKDPPWVNLDVVQKWPGAPRPCDVVWDARKDPIPFPDDSADEIYAGYLLLHLAPRFHRSVLADVRRVAVPDARIVFGEVDFDVVFQDFLKNPFDPRTSELIWGEQGNRPGDEPFEAFDKHCQGFNERSLRHLLRESGFGDFRRIRLHAVAYELTLECRKV